jgi:putative FmdB family regulatory protein
MPTYDYVCDACGHALEIFQSINDAPKKKCPKCGKSKLHRRIGAGAGILFKGTGFYQTDYRSSEYKADAKKDSDSSGSTSSPSSDSTKSDAAPAPKSEAKSEPKPAPSKSSSDSKPKKSKD